MIKSVRYLLAIEVMNCVKINIRDNNFLQDFKHLYPKKQNASIFRSESKVFGVETQFLSPSQNNVQRSQLLQVSDPMYCRKSSCQWWTTRSARLGTVLRVRSCGSSTLRSAPVSRRVAKTPVR